MMLVNIYGLLLLAPQKELGHPLASEDHPFVSTYEDPITGHHVQQLVGVLLDRLGLPRKKREDLDRCFLA